MHSLKYLNKGLCALWLATLLAVGHSAHAQVENEPACTNSIYQYSALTGNQRAYLWIPPKSQQVRGLIISFANLLEHSWLESAIIRQEAARDDLGILLIEKGTTITPAFNTTTPAALLQLLKNLAQQSGYPEIQHAALLPIEHSIHGVFTWNIAHWAPERTIAAIPVKTFPLPDTIDFSGVPVCYIIGETDEWPAVNDGHAWDRDYVWPLIRNSATRLRTLYPQNLVGVVTDPGGGHLDWSDRLSRFMALYIHKACLYRLPKKLPMNGPVKLNTIKAQQGWLTDTGGMLPDQFAPAPYLQYQGDVKTAYWFFDEQTARAATHFCGDRIKRDKQMLSFLQHDSLVAVSRQGYVPLVYLPQNDSMSFKLQSAFLPVMPQELTNAGQPLGHAGGPIKLRVICGPAQQTDSNLFEIHLNRITTIRDVWIQAEHSGDARYRHAVQPAVVKLSWQTNHDSTQTIIFPKPANQKAGVKQLKLNGTTSNGLPARYYVVHGPAFVNKDTLHFTPVPRKSHYPVQVTVVAYHLRMQAGKIQHTAMPVTQSFFIYK